MRNLSWLREGRDKVDSGGMPHQFHTLSPECYEICHSPWINQSAKCSEDI